MRTAYKCRAYPDQAQASVLNRTSGCVRVAWNQTLAWRRQRYHTSKTGTTFAQANAYLTAMKATEELAWLNAVSSVPLQQVIRQQQAIRHQQAAYAGFFAKLARYPRFKSRNGRQSAEYTRSAFRWRDGRLHLAKMSTPLAFTWSWPGTDPASVDPSTVTVSRDPCGRSYVAFAVDTPAPEPLPATGLVRDHDVIAVEDPAVTNIVRNRTLAQAIANCGWGTFRAMHAYKAARNGRRVIIADRWYPSSKTCSACGYLLAELGLGPRTWPCPCCGTRHDRGHNAAKNILAAGRAVAGDNPGHACGAGIRHSGASRVQSAVNRNPGP